MKKKKDSLYEIGGINKKTSDVLFGDYPEEMTEEDAQNSTLMSIIEIFTTIREKSIFASLVKKKLSLKYHVNFNDIKYNEETGQYELKTVDGEFYSFDKISRKFEDDKMDKMVKELESDKRYGYCHSNSEEMVMLCSDCDIVTGYVKKYDMRYLHSFIELKHKKDRIVWDYSKNLIMKKKDYIKLTDFKEIIRSSDIDFLEDMKIIGSIPDLNQHSALHLIFRKEILEDLKRKNIMPTINPFLEENTNYIIQEKLKAREERAMKKETEKEER